MQRIKDAGGHAKHYPVIKICDVDDANRQLAIINKLSDFDLAIFISPTAVQQTLSKVKSLPTGLTLVVIGRSTEAMLNNHGLQADIVPADFHTESLLRHPALQQEKINGQSVVIFRGKGGRELLGKTLSERGASVSYAEMYQRIKNSINSLSHNELNSIDMLTVTSNEGLQNLYDLTNDKSLLTTRPIIVPSRRARALANRLGFGTIIQSENATDDACMQALALYWSTKA
ncbi:MAG: uroporphyrinogen-III synthase [Gammaproteobacteria bacterium]|nr:uroporphyrinogen-III synthase [Gammaproteobacteria bacterium]MCW8924420.1 uroporphyrinogen-III synthase [Gammaproteobacteria bacterium]